MKNILSYLPFIGGYIKQIKKQEKIIKWYNTYTKNLTNNLKDAWNKNKQLEEKIREGKKNKK